MKKWKAPTYIEILWVTCSWCDSLGKAINMRFWDDVWVCDDCLEETEWEV